MPAKKEPEQLSFPGLDQKTKKRAHGGEQTRGKRKKQRPFHPKQALHVVLRSSKARGQLSLLHRRNCNQVSALVTRLKKRWGVTVYRYANVGNHLHLLIRCPSRELWQGFIRELSGGIAIIVTGAKKGCALPRTRNSTLSESAQRAFWDELVFTRIVQFGPDFNNVARYVCKNLWESFGIPVRSFLARGFKILELAEEGAIFAGPGAALKIAQATHPG